MVLLQNSFRGLEMKKIFIALMVMLLFVAVPAFAQDVTEVPTVDTVEEVVETPTPEVIVPDIIVVNPPATDDGDVPDNQVVTWTGVGTLLAIAAGVVGAVLGFIGWRKANPEGDVDTKVSELIDARRLDRVWMEKLETVYQERDQSQKDAIETLSETLRYVATLTGLRFDDKLSELIEDIQEPGDGSTPPESPTAKF
jgi:hypothetical protein